MRYFCVQTLVDGSWRNFTIGAIEGEDEANLQLSAVREFAVKRKKDPDEDVRLRELSDEETKRYLLIEYMIPIQRYLASLPVEEIEKFCSDGLALLVSDRERAKNV